VGADAELERIALIHTRSNGVMAQVAGPSTRSDKGRDYNGFACPAAHGTTLAKRGLHTGHGVGVPHDKENERMEIGKNIKSMRTRIADQIEARLERVNLDSLLGAVGLQFIKRSKGFRVWPLAAAFAGGMVAGMLVAPMSGKELRGKITLLAKKLQARAGARELTATGEPVESPYEKAKSEHDADGSNGQKKKPWQGEDSASAMSTAT
jgi:hypothetical protein